MRRAAIAALLAVLAIAVLAAGCGGAAGLGGDDTQPIQPARDRRPAPAVSVAALDGGPELTLASREGRPVILNFWASWCEPCQRETPALVAFSKANPGLDVVGLAVNDRPADSRRFAAQMKIPYDLGADRDADVASEFGVQGLPVTVIIDAEGRIADTFAGEITRAQLDGYAAQLLP
jgi:cytochrome c biogenesis protein CcmG/thiol:disulfide interchange protein DsbE